MELLQVATNAGKSILSTLWEHLNLNWLWTAIILPVFHYGRKWYKIEVNWRKAMNTLKTDYYTAIPQINEKLDRVIEQFTPNGGGTLRDALDGIKISLRRLGGRQKIDVAKPTVIFNSDGTLIDANDSFLDLTGRDLKDCLEHNWVNCLYIMDRSDVEKEFSDQITKKRISEIECRIVNGDGKPVRVKMISTPTLSPTGNVIEYICNIKILN